MILVKDSVRFRVLRHEIYNLLGPLEDVFQEEFGVSMVITCGTDAHPPTDPHFNGFAIDVRSKHIPDFIKDEVLAALRDTCGRRYTVLLEGKGTENEHFHIQVKKDLWPKLLEEGSTDAD